MVKIRITRKKLQTRANLEKQLKAEKKKSSLRKTKSGMRRKLA